MRAILLALALLTVTTDVLATGAVWTGKRVKVYNYTPSAWDATVRDVVRDVARILPNHAPRVIVKPRGERRCRDLPARKRWRGVALCVGNGDWTVSRIRHGAFVRATVSIDPNPDPGDSIAQALCHELMHALTGVGDSNAFDDPYPRPKTSCVHGNVRESPGSWDRRFAHKVYRKHGRH